MYCFSFKISWNSRNSIHAPFNSPYIFCLKIEFPHRPWSQYMTLQKTKSTNRYLHDSKPRFVNIITCMWILTSMMSKFHVHDVTGMDVLIQGPLNQILWFITRQLSDPVSRTYKSIFSKIFKFQKYYLKF